MLSQETDLVTYLLADNRKLRQLYLTEQKKALTERKRRIIAEARLAALLSKEVIKKRERNSSHSSRQDRNLFIANEAHKDLLGNGRNPNSIGSSHEDQIALLGMNNIRGYQKNISTSESPVECTASSIRSMLDVNIPESCGKANLPHTTFPDKQSTDSFNDKANSAQCSLKLPQNNFEKQESAKLSKFWLFIDRNGETKSSIPPPLNQIQQKRKEAFIRRSTERQILIREASVCRKELAAAKRKVAKQLLAGHTVNQNAVKVLGLMDRDICAFPPQTMKHETVRRVRKTREFQEKKKQRREEYDAHINRLLAYCYSQVPYKFYQKY
ncbi:unnamed protein product [Cercopithifilaria johnstoni]|uniref:ALMS motif domain-containing protein n=1 Tax=Cercopithifilaria johnstoni TaxID=2874296 RepID=A0A8J2PZQ5_9BILA|nr:unnamed protein product [Cercopithifilaria johnstoni]